MKKLICTSFVLFGISSVGSAAMSQTTGEKESFTAVAIVNNNLGAGAGTVLIDITRWSTEAERTALVNAVVAKGPAALLEVLRDSPSTGTIRTPDSLAYDLRFARQTSTAEKGRR